MSFYLTHHLSKLIKRDFSCVLLKINVRYIQESTSVSQAFRIVKLWSILTTIFFILITAEVYVGLVHVVLDTWSVEFLVFNILKLFWRLIAFYFVGRFAFELKYLGGAVNSNSEVVVTKSQFGVEFPVRATEQNLTILKETKGVNVYSHKLKKLAFTKFAKQNFIICT